MAAGLGDRQARGKGGQGSGAGQGGSQAEGWALSGETATSAPSLGPCPSGAPQAGGRAVPAAGRRPCCRGKGGDQQYGFGAEPGNLPEVTCSFGVEPGLQ